MIFKEERRGVSLMTNFLQDLLNRSSSKYQSIFKEESLFLEDLLKKSSKVSSKKNHLWHLKEEYLLEFIAWMISKENAEEFL